MEWDVTMAEIIELAMIYGVFVYILVTGMMLFWVKTDLINKIKSYFLAPKGAKVFRLYKKDGTEEEFVECCRPGGVIKHEGDVYAILKGTIAVSRSKNAPTVTLVEGNLNSVDVFNKIDNRVDTKQLRALFFAEREKAKSDLNPDVKLLKTLLLITIIIAIIVGLISYFNFTTGEQVLAAVKAAKAATVAAGATTL